MGFIYFGLEERSGFLQGGQKSGLGDKACLQGSRADCRSICGLGCRLHISAQLPAHLCPCSRAPVLCVCYRSKKSAFFFLGLTGRTGTALSWGGRAWRDAPGCPLLPFGVLCMHAGTCLQAHACSHLRMCMHEHTHVCMHMYVPLYVHRKAGCDPGVQQQMQRAGNEPGRKSRRAGALSCISLLFKHFPCSRSALGHRRLMAVLPGREAAGHSAVPSADSSHFGGWLQGFSFSPLPSPDGREAVLGIQPRWGWTLPGGQGGKKAHKESGKEIGEHGKGRVRVSSEMGLPLPCGAAEKIPLPLPFSLPPLNPVFLSLCSLWMMGTTASTAQQAVSASAFESVHGIGTMEDQRSLSIHSFQTLGLHNSKAKSIITNKVAPVVIT